MRRREFLKAAAAASATLVSGDVSMGGEDRPSPESAPSSNAAKLPHREYGATGTRLSIIGMGGLVLKSMAQPKADRLVAEVVERGMNYFDVAPTYGNAEVRLGPALKPYRKKVFLACKTTARQQEPARAEFEQSLRRLQTDHFDLYQLHAITDVSKDVDAAFDQDGVMKFLINAKKEGRVRFLGFSAHSVEAARAALQRYDFDSILFPVNFAAFYKNDFGPQIVDYARSRKVAILALKALARQVWPKDDPNRKKYKKCWYQPLIDPHETELGLRFTLSQPVTAAVPPGEESLFRLAVDLAMRFRPLEKQGEDMLKTLADHLNPIFPVA